MDISIFVDIGFVVIIAIFAIVGLVRGFSKSLISILGSVGSIVIAALVAVPFANLINSWFGANAYFGHLISGAFSDPGYSVVYTMGLSAGEAINAAGVIQGGWLHNLVYQYVFAKSGVAEGGTLGGTIGASLGSLVVIIMAAVIAWIVIRIILWIVQRFLYKVTAFTIFGGLDKILGFVFGGAEGFVFMGVLCVVASGLTLVHPAIDRAITPVLQDTKIVSMVYAPIDQWTQDNLGKQIQDIANKLFKVDTNGTKQKTIQYFRDEMPLAQEVYVDRNIIYVLNKADTAGAIDTAAVAAGDLDSCSYYINYDITDIGGERNMAWNVLAGMNGTGFNLVINMDAVGSDGVTPLSDELLTYILTQNSYLKEYYDDGVDTVYFRTAYSADGIDPSSPLTASQFYIKYDTPDELNYILGFVNI